MKVQFGLYDVSGRHRRLCGVAMFGVPVSTVVLTNPLPHLCPSVLTRRPAGRSTRALRIHWQSQML